MLVPLSWLLEYSHLEQAQLPQPVDPAEVARRLTAVGLEIEGLQPVGHDVSGVVVARVLEIEELNGHKKPIRYCRVTAGDTSSDERWVICGAVNFVVGDLVPLALPGAVLPGGFEIAARPAYGRLSDGMICSAAELALGDDHSGILVLPPDSPLGADFAEYAGLRDVVLDVNVTPDKGHALSIRGMARELASAFAVSYTDPAGVLDDRDAPSAEVYQASIADPTACDRFALREVRGIDPARPTPLRMRVRLARAGMRSVSLAVDVTNYLMLELGQPLHAFDRSALSGPIVVRRALAEEKLETLDHVVRALDPEDILITVSSGPISLAGTMGGVATEVSPSSRDVVIEAAHFSARGIARESRRHRLFSEASARFERGVDPELPMRASARAATMLAALGGGTVVPGSSMAAAEIAPVTIAMASDYPDRVAGVVYGLDTVRARLREVGCTVIQKPEDQIAEPDGGVVATAADPSPAGRSSGHLTVRHTRHDHGRHDRPAMMLLVTPPSWRPDLTDPADLAEEVIRLEGYQNVPVTAVRAAAGKGLTNRQRLRRAAGRALAYGGFVEVMSHPFTSVADFDRLQLPPEDPARLAVRLANPLTEDEPLLRTALLPGLLRTLVRNVGRGFGDAALYEFGLVFRPRAEAPAAVPILRVDRGPTVHEIAE